MISPGSNARAEPPAWMNALATTPIIFALLACAGPGTPAGTARTTNTTIAMNEEQHDSAAALDTIVLGAGCFWCTEAVFAELKGVVSVMPGYTGGHTTDPDYKSVCSGGTGHAEVARVVFDPRVVSLDAILEVFWQTHDPTTPGRQGADVGTQYRSAVFYRNAEQQAKAAHYKAELDRSGAFPRPIVTEIVPLTVFWPAENYHRDYYANNPEQGYCQMVIRPKLEKCRKAFANRLK